MGETLTEVRQNLSDLRVETIEILKSINKTQEETIEIQNRHIKTLEEHLELYKADSDADGRGETETS